MCSTNSVLWYCLYIITSQDASYFSVLPFEWSYRLGILIFFRFIIGVFILAFESVDETPGFIQKPDATEQSLIFCRTVYSAVKDYWFYIDFWSVLSRCINPEVITCSNLKAYEEKLSCKVDLNLVQYCIISLVSSFHFMIPHRVIFFC